MTINNLTLITYAPTAYNSTAIPDQPAAKVIRDDGFSTRLPWGNTQAVIPVHVMGETNRFELEEKQKSYEKINSITGKYDEAFNHIQIRPGSFTKATSFWMFVYSLGKGLTFVMFIVLLLVYISFIFTSNVGETFYSIFKSILPALLMLQCPPVALWLIAYLYLKLFGFKTGQGSPWAFNRQTGMVTLYQQHGEKGQQQRVAIEKPFYEFDGYLMALLTPKGLVYYHFYLQHRYQKELLIKNPFLPYEMGNKQGVYAHWYFIQNYMDVSQPLPDVGSLEFFRAYDPTTVAYDQQTNRNPRYWRDMPLEQWKIKFDEMTKQNFDIQLNNLNIMDKHVKY